ncbi:MAG: M14 family zinc carboxypeptidase [Candidatus Bathyarchaeia archaeon]
MSEGIPTPSEFFNHQMGAERRLARWDRIVEYFWELDSHPCIDVVDLGESTEGNPFLLALISSPENLERSKEYREMSYRIAHPEGLTEEEVEEIIEKGRSVVCMTMSIHATEVGGTQMAPELAYDLATKSEHADIRDETILLLFPCFNPDGQIMVTDWYNKYLDTEYEGCSPPWLYHKYTGHDNNRDAIHLNMVESKHVAKVMYREWFPQAYIDFHHMGSYGARFYIAPFANPVDEKVDPLVWTEQELYGGLTHVMLENEGKTGVESAATYPGEFMPTFNYVPCWNNICGMLTESASANLATPLYIHPHQLRESRRGRPEYRTQMGFPHPWEGGWWTLRDIVEQQKIAALGTLKAAARFREVILRDMYQKATRGIQKGRMGDPYAFIVKPLQHNILMPYKLLGMLMDMGVEVQRSKQEFIAEGVTYPEGTYVVLASQPARPFIVSLLKRTFYHAGPFTKKPDGTPIIPYDLATYTVAEFMGIDLHEVSEPFEAPFEEVKTPNLPEMSVAEGVSEGWILDARINKGYAAIHSLLDKGVEVHRTLEEMDVDDKTYPRGSWFIPQTPEVRGELIELAERYNLNFDPAPQGLATNPVRMLRTGIYQRYYGGNADEGWTRWLSEQYNFPYKTVMDEDVHSGHLSDNFDLIILPSDAKEMIIGKDLEEYWEKRWGGGFTMPNYPPEYYSGIGEEGVEKMKEFVDEGGTLLCFGEACNFAIDELDIPVKNVLKDVEAKEFLCPGSTLHVDVDEEHPLTTGVQDDLLIVFRNHPAFEVKPRVNNDDYKVVLSYPKERIMESGWLIGEEKLSRKAALIDARVGEGRVILYGFQPQFRAQTDATFKLLFNALTAPVK